MTSVITTVNELREKVLYNDRDLGFVGQSSDIIIHTCRLLGPNLIDVKINDQPSNWYMATTRLLCVLYAL